MLIALKWFNTVACLFARYGSGSSKNKQEYKPDVKLEYFDDNGRPLTPKEVRFIRKPLFSCAVLRSFPTIACLDLIIGFCAAFAQLLRWYKFV